MTQKTKAPALAATPPMARRQSEPFTVTISEACELSNLDPMTIRGLIASGRLHTVCVGRRRPVLYPSLQRLVQRGRSETAQQRGKQPASDAALNDDC